MEPEEKLRKHKEAFLNSSKIHEKDKQLLDQYLEQLERKGSQSGYTKSKYVKWLRKLLEHHDDLHLHELPQIYEENELVEVNQEIAKNIQASKYKVREGDYAKRTKNDIWYAWKRAMQLHSIPVHEHLEHIPDTKFTSDEKRVDKQADTKPEDLPTPGEMRELLQGLEQVSDSKTSLRNVMIPLFIWDTGVRRGELQEIKMKHIDVRGNSVKVFIPGNKGADDRKVQVFQGRKTLQDYVQRHPGKGDREAYLFPQIYQEDEYAKFSERHVKTKIRAAKAKRSLGFKLYGEPFHIFRKAMNTYYRVNDVLTWEEICTRLGKSPDATKPDYLLMAMQDIDSSAAEAFGVQEAAGDQDYRMKDSPLMPRECSSCGRENRCYKEVCEACGTELPESELPKGEAFQEEAKDKNQEIGKIQGLIKALNASGVDIDEQEVEKYL